MPNTYTELDKITLSSAAASATFSSISSSYTDLVIIATGTASALSNLSLRFNGDTASNYSRTSLYGNGSSATSYRVSNYSGIPLGDFDTSQIATHIINIQNYSNATTNKTVIARWNNNAGTYASLGATASLWRSTAAITSVTLYSDGGNLSSGCVFSLYGIAAAPVPVAKATGGTITYDVQYTYHTFTASGTFTPQVGLTADCLVIAGGGGAGAGGGGAGGLVYNSATALANATNYSVTIGAGGTGGVNNSSQATNGVNSNITGGVLSLTAAVGGGKGGTGNRPVLNYDGGSGGGSNRQTDAAGVATSGQGSNGGVGFTDSASFDNGGGGGGFSVAGTTANFTTCGQGGNGSSTYSSWGLATSTGQNVSGTYWYAGGGSGGTNLSKTVFAGGNGGGGAGATTGTGGAGTANTGGGGGGTNTGGAGGSGIVIIRYPN
jgi:hypothetical protein